MALADDRHDGYGYAESQRLPRRFGLALDEALLIAANLAGWDYEQLFEWANSRPARWFVDEASRFLGGPTPDATTLVPLAARYVK